VATIVERAQSVIGELGQGGREEKDFENRRLLLGSSSGEEGEKERIGRVGLCRWWGRRRGW
jgi:hypothetical protein